MMPQTTPVYTPSTDRYAESHEELHVVGEFLWK